MKEVEVTGNLLGGIVFLKIHGQRYFSAALQAAASIIKDETKKQLSSAIPRASEHNPKYSDTLLDAVRSTKTLGDEISVHILGTNATGSGTYRTRFFEDVTRERYQKVVNGKRLNKNRYLGRVGGKKFFSTAISISAPQAMQEIQNRIDKLIDRANEQ